MGSGGVDHGRGHVGRGRPPAPRWEEPHDPRAAPQTKAEERRRGAAGAEPRTARAGWHGESGVLTEVSSRYTSGYWKDSMAGAGRGLKVGSAGEAGRGLRRRAACERADSWRAGVHGRTHGGAGRQAGRRCRPGREPLPGGRAQAAARGSGVSSAGARAGAQLPLQERQPRPGARRSTQATQRHAARRPASGSPALSRLPSFRAQEGKLYLFPGLGRLSSPLQPATLDMEEEMLQGDREGSTPPSLHPSLSPPQPLMDTGSSASRLWRFFGGVTKTMDDPLLEIY